MKIPSPRSTTVSLRIIFVVIIAIAVGISWWTLSRPRHKITDRELLREAVAEWQRGGSPGGAIGGEIFEQQARQGYYDDAAWTGRHFHGADEVRWSVVELARIRAANGDVSGARATIESFIGSDLEVQIVEAVALACVARGDLRGALEIAGARADRDKIFLAYARHKLEQNDFAAALETATLMKSPSQVFYAVGDALTLRGEQNRVSELASRMKDRKLAAKFKALPGVVTWPTVENVIQATPCSIAADYGDQGRFAEAAALIEQHKCNDMSYVAIKHYAFDPSGAEHLLRTRSTTDDLLFGLDQFAIQAAKEGKISEAFRFLRDLENLNARSSVAGGSIRITEAVRGIAQYWTVRVGPKMVLSWVRSRPTSQQRTYGLLGMAAGLAQPRNAE